MLNPIEYIPSCEETLDNAVLVVLTLCGQSLIRHSGKSFSRQQLQTPLTWTRAATTSATAPSPCGPDLSVDKNSRDGLTTGFKLNQWFVTFNARTNEWHIKPVKVPVKPLLNLSSPDLGWVNPFLTRNMSSTKQTHPSSIPFKAT